MKLQKRRPGNVMRMQISGTKRQRQPCIAALIFSGTGLELVTKPATIRCPYHSATAATKNNRKAGGGRTVTSVAAKFGINKSVVSRALKAFQTTGLKILVVAVRGRQLQERTDVSSCRRKEVDNSQQAPLLSNSVQQRGDKCRGLLWPDTFKKGGLFAHRPERCLPLKVAHRRHRLQWCREHKNWTTVNGVVSSLRMRVGSVPEAIATRFDLERSKPGFIPVTSRKDTVTVVLESLPGEALC
ncbi:transposable element Tcb2 transposase [Trichonephila clavipes]|nr:transposable element Tcb2 transposase [Trichonephila clavipes]